MIVDYKRFKPGQPLRDGLLWVLEQLPTLVVSRDVTDTLRQQTFWPSYNSPYFTSIYNLSGVNNFLFMSSHSISQHFLCDLEQANCIANDSM